MPFCSSKIQNFRSLIIFILPASYRLPNCKTMVATNPENVFFLVHTGFPKKDARFSKLKNIPDLLSDDRERNRRLLWETL